ncbi:ABC transporter ATP-binding protein/permease [Paenibacillus camelliae]|nr:ABC transporter ATP-binding protein/permease [Paenibacillus camelliae]
MKTGKRLLQYGLLYKKTIIVALIFLIIAVSAEVMGPLLAKKMIDEHITGINKTWYYVEEGTAEAVPYKEQWLVREDKLNPSTAVLGSMEFEQQGLRFYLVNEGDNSEQATLLTKEELYQFYKPEIPSILRLSAIYLVLLAVAAIFVYSQRILLQTAANRIVQKLRHDVYAHTQKLPVKYYDHYAAGQIVSRVTNDTEAIRELYVGVIANFSMGLVYIVAIYAAIFAMNPTLGFITLPLIPILMLWIYIYRRFASKYNRVLRAKLSEINGTVNESIQGMSIIQAFRKEKAMEKEFDELNSYYFKYQNKMLSLNSWTSHNLLNVLRNLIYAVILVLFFTNQLGAAITVGLLFAYIDYLNRMFNPIVGIVNQLSNLEVARVSAERVFKLMDEPGMEVDDQPMPRYRGDVAFENVSFAYKEKEYVLKNIQFSAKQGETIALVGHTGSGKSSILNLLFRFYDIEEGRITIDGVDLRSFSKQQIRKHMGIVLQDPFLFTGTIASNVSLNNEEISRERVIQALKDVGAYDMFMQLPKGIDTEVIEKGSTLSAGQRQLISFARALAYDPAILILDEATASIDTETESVIQAALEVLKRGRTTFVIAHRLSTIRAADQILVLDRGVIVERGNHDQLMEQRGKYYLMYQLQAGTGAITA